MQKNFRGNGGKVTMHFPKEIVPEFTIQISKYRILYDFRLLTDDEAKKNNSDTYWLKLVIF